MAGVAFGTPVCLLPCVKHTHTKWTALTTLPLLWLQSHGHCTQPRGASIAFAPLCSPNFSNVSGFFGLVRAVGTWVDGDVSIGDRGLFAGKGNQDAGIGSVCLLVEDSACFGKSQKKLPKPMSSYNRRKAVCVSFARFRIVSK